jgi:hypothetical protein
MQQKYTSYREWKGADRTLYNFANAFLGPGACVDNLFVCNAPYDTVGQGIGNQRNDSNGHSL